MTREPVEQLFALEAIRRLKARYCRLVDTKQWGPLEQLFIPDAKLDGFGSVPDGTDPATFVAGIAARLEQAVTIHHVQAPEIELTGPASARGVWSMMDYVDFQATGAPADVTSGRGWIGWGYYEEEYVRLEDTWRFSYMRLTRQRLDDLAADHPLARFSPHGPSTDWLQEFLSRGGKQ